MAIKKNIDKIGITLLIATLTDGYFYAVKEK